MRSDVTKVLEYSFSLVFNFPPLMKYNTLTIRDCLILPDD